MSARNLLAAAGGISTEKNYIEDVFSTWLYAGNITTQTITNGINLADKGGLTWVKRRNLGQTHVLVDTARGPSNYLYTHLQNPQQNLSGSITGTSSGFTLVNDTSGFINDAGGRYVSWTFRKQPKFFDVVTYTGNGDFRTVQHNLGAVPGCIIIKRTDSTSDWIVWHRDLSAQFGPETPTNYIRLNSSATESSDLTLWNTTAATATTFDVASGGSVDMCVGGATYVAYLFAHNAGGFGELGTDSVISCGSYTGNGSTTGPVITLGWEPQWLLIKSASGTAGSWYIIDNMRGFVNNGIDARLKCDTTDAEILASLVSPTATGFQINTTNGDYNSSGSKYIYIAIRRGPMKPPDSPNKVFTATTYTGNNLDYRKINTGILTDLALIRLRPLSTIAGMYTGSRLTGNEFMITGLTNSAAIDGDSFMTTVLSIGNGFSEMDGVGVGNDATRQFNVDTGSNNHIIYSFSRAPKFFDVVSYTGNGDFLSIPHNLGAVPGCIIIKSRTSTSDWIVWHRDLSAQFGPETPTNYIRLNTSATESSDLTLWNTTAATATTFDVASGGSVDVCVAATTYIAYLFAECPGVSALGSYTGNGSTQTINMGFTAGTRFFLVKRIDAAGDWWVWDTARGIVESTDPVTRLSFSVAAAEITNTDAVDSTSVGIIVNQEATCNINVSGAKYIYFGIA